MKSNIIKIAVTGASGFLGSHICEALHESGYEVHALIRSTSSRRWINYPWLHIHELELDDRSALSSILVNVDAVIHAAGALWGQYHSVNTDITRIMAEESTNAGIKKFIYVSSIAAGGPSTGPYQRNGNEPDTPCTLYGISKKDAERLLSAMAGNLEIVILRYPMIYGPRDTQGLRLFRTFNIFINPSVGVRHRFISVVYVKDAARAAVTALESCVKSGSIYNISDGSNNTFNELYRIIAQVWHRWALRIPVPFALIMFGAWFINKVLKVKTVFNPEQLEMFSSLYWLISPEKAMRELSWFPETPVRKGVKLTLEWYKEMKWL
jgi:nucleoside-diphosphate-sugar epimerase